MKHKIRILNLIVLALTLGCAKKAQDDQTSSLEILSKKIYVTTGACNSGTGITTYTTTATRSIESYSNEDGSHLSTLLYYGVPGLFVAATHPHSVVDAGDSLYVLNENSTTVSERKLIEVPKGSPTRFSIFYANPTALNAPMMSLFKDNDGSFLISKNTAIEKVNSTQIRVLAGTNPWISAPAGNCATSVTAISTVLALPSLTSGSTGKIVFTHQGSTAALNRIGIVSSSGYFAASDCLSGVQISSVTHTKASNLTAGTVAFNAVGTTPTAAVFIPHPNGTVTGKLVVSYSNGQTSNNNAGVYNLNHGIVMWDVNEPSDTSASLTNPVVVYDDSSVVFGISAMAYDADNEELYVATAGEPGAVNQTTNGYGYNIEKFSVSIDSNGAPTLRRISTGNQPFIKGGLNTKCISGMTLGS